MHAISQAILALAPPSCSTSQLRAKLLEQRDCSAYCFARKAFTCELCTQEGSRKSGFSLGLPQYKQYIALLRERLCILPKKVKACANYGQGVASNKQSNPSSAYNKQSNPYLWLPRTQFLRKRSKAIPMGASS